MRRKIITDLLALAMMAGPMFTRCAGDGAPAGGQSNLGMCSGLCEASTHLAQAVIIWRLGYEVR